MRVSIALLADSRSLLNIVPTEIHVLRIAAQAMKYETKVEKYNHFNINSSVGGLVCSVSARVAQSEWVDLIRLAECSFHLFFFDNSTYQIKTSIFNDLAAKCIAQSVALQTNININKYIFDKKK